MVVAFFDNGTHLEWNEIIQVGNSEDLEFLKPLSEYKLYEPDNQERLIENLIVPQKTINNLIHPLYHLSYVVEVDEYKIPSYFYVFNYFIYFYLNLFLFIFIFFQIFLYIFNYF